MEDMSDLFAGSPIPRPGFGPAFKLAMVAGLIFVLMVPLLLVSQLIAERESRADSVRLEIAGLWGHSQLINGPVVVVPYTVTRVTMQGDKRVEEVIERRAVFLPEALDGSVDGRRRNIYDVVLRLQL